MVGMLTSMASDLAGGIAGACAWLSVGIIGGAGVGLVRHRR